MVHAASESGPGTRCAASALARAADSRRGGGAPTGRIEARRVRLVDALPKPCRLACGRHTVEPGARAVWAALGKPARDGARATPGAYRVIEFCGLPPRSVHASLHHLRTPRHERQCVRARAQWVMMFRAHPVVRRWRSGSRGGSCVRESTHALGSRAREGPRVGKGPRRMPNGVKIAKCGTKGTTRTADSHQSYSCKGGGHNTPQAIPCL